MTRADRLIVATVLAAALLLAPQAGALLEPQAGSIVLKGPGGVTEVDPGRDGTYVVPGRIGSVVFEARGGQLRARAADCPDHICIRSGSVAAGRPVICAPNGVSATLVAGKTEALDAVSR